jgi:hypothetical protein
MNTETGTPDTAATLASESSTQKSSRRADQEYGVREKKHAGVNVHALLDPTCRETQLNCRLAALSIPGIRPSRTVCSPSCRLTRKRALQGARAGSR